MREAFTSTCNFEQTAFHYYISLQLHKALNPAFNQRVQEYSDCKQRHSSLLKLRKAFTGKRQPDYLTVALLLRSWTSDHHRAQWLKSYIDTSRYSWVRGMFLDSFGWGLDRIQAEAYEHQDLTADYPRKLKGAMSRSILYSSNFGIQLLSHNTSNFVNQPKTSYLVSYGDHTPLRQVWDKTALLRNKRVSTLLIKLSSADWSDGSSHATVKHECNTGCQNAVQDHF